MACWRWCITRRSLWKSGEDRSLHRPRPPVLCADGGLQSLSTPDCRESRLRRAVALCGDRLIKGIDLREPGIARYFCKRSECENEGSRRILVIIIP